MFPPRSEQTPLSGIQGSAGCLLIAVAAGAEARAIRSGFTGSPGLEPDSATPPGEQGSRHGWHLEQISPGIDLIETGVGKAQAAGGTAWAFDPSRHSGVLSVGVGGSLPSKEPPPIGSAVLATRSIFADEGISTPTGFRFIDAIGFPPGSPAGGFGSDGMACDPAWSSALMPLVERTGVIATVSACSGTDSAARAVFDRTGAIVENMEGAAVAAVLSNIPADSRPRFAEIRVISNTTGDRDQQEWDLKASLARLGTITARAARQICGKNHEINSGP